MEGEELVAVDAQPDKVATDEPVARDGAAQFRGKAGLELPSDSSWEEFASVRFFEDELEGARSGR